MQRAWLKGNLARLVGPGQDTACSNILAQSEQDYTVLLINRGRFWHSHVLSLQENNSLKLFQLPPFPVKQASVVYGSSFPGHINLQFNCPGEHTQQIGFQKELQTFEKRTHPKIFQITNWLNVSLLWYPVSFMDYKCNKIDSYTSACQTLRIFFNYIFTNSPLSRTLTPIVSEHVEALKDTVFTVGNPH